jgi:hypothetical protein
LGNRHGAKCAKLRQGILCDEDQKSPGASVAVLATWRLKKLTSFSLANS